MNKPKLVNVYIVTMMLNRTVYNHVTESAEVAEVRGIHFITCDKSKAEEHTELFQDRKAKMITKRLDSTQLYLLLADNIDNWNFNRDEFSAYNMKKLFAA